MSDNKPIYINPNKETGIYEGLVGDVSSTSTLTRKLESTKVS
jgi:hypothetical protein